MVWKKKESLRSLGVDIQLCFSPFPTAASVREDARIFSRVIGCLFMRKPTFFLGSQVNHTHMLMRV